MDSDFIMSISSIALAVITALGTMLVTFFKTRTKAIEKKVDKTINDVSNTNMTKYYVVIDDKKYRLSDLTIYKEDTTDEKKTNE